MLRLRLVFPIFAFIAIAVAAGCGGGGGGSSVPAAPTPHSGPTTVPVGPTPQVVSLTGGGYTLTFTVPTLLNGSTATMTATLQTQLPTGVNAPQLRRAKNIGAGVSGLVYLVVTTNASVELGSAPSFVFTLPQGTTIASGQSAYLLYWDPNVGPLNGWINLLGPGTFSSPTVTFPSVNTDIKLNANAQYIYALAVTNAAVPTATPAPTSAPTTTPSPGPLASYCANYAANANDTVPVNITDDSALGAVLVLYITNAGNSLFMDASGNFTSSVPVPIPAACFSTTTGSSATNKPLGLPTGVTGGRIYLAYATPAPGSAVPNPFLGATISGPNVGYSANPFPWDKIEYATTGGATIDTTQVDALGLPLELSVTSGALPHQAPGTCPTSPISVVGVSSCNYAKIFQAMNAISQYSNLVVQQTFNGQLIDFQIVAPKDAVTFTSFDWNLFGDSVPTPTPTFCNGASNYLGCLLAAYNTGAYTTGRLFQTSGIGANTVSGDNYCATSDGVSNFVFTDVGSATSCATATTKQPVSPLISPFKIPVQELTYGLPPANDGGGACKQNILFSQPWGNADVGSNFIFAGPDAFALWKDLTADINRGTMLSTTQTHPIGLTNPTLSLFFKDPMYNQYAQVLHTYFDQNLAYAIAYDDLGGFESGVIWQSGEAFNIRVNQVPSASSATAVPVPVAVPSPCPALPMNVGTF